MNLVLPSETRMSSLVLREYQKNVVDLIQETDAKSVLWLPTGGGKTEIAVQLTKDELSSERSSGVGETTKGSVLFICERKTLVKQSVMRFKKYGIEPGVIQGANTTVGSHYTPKDSDRACSSSELRSDKVVVASIQTLQSRKDLSEIRNILKNVSLILIDECHILYTHVHQVIKECRDDVRVIGLSATPLKPELNMIYENLIKGPSYADLIEEGYLVKPRYYLPTLDEEFERDLNQVKITSMGDYASGDLSILMRNHKTLSAMVKNWKESAEDRPTIIFCVNKLHSEAVSEAFRAKGINASHIEDTTPDKAREEAFRAFRTGEVKVLCSVGVLSLGFDMPEASCVILARPTLSLALHVQQIGRGLRVCESKSDCLIFDYSLNLMKHGVIEEFDPPALDRLTKFSDKKDRAFRKALYKSCVSCNALMNPDQKICSDCGTEEPEKDLSEVYREFLWIARDRGYSKGWSYYKFKEYVNDDTNPDFSWNSLEPIKPSREVRLFVGAKNAEYRKKKLKAKYAKQKEATA